MTETQVSYQTRITRFVPSGAGVQKVLNADARRWFVEFRPGANNPQIQWVYPGNAAMVPALTATTADRQDWHFRDAPAALVGDWWVLSDGLIPIMCIEQLYTGG